MQKIENIFLMPYRISSLDRVFISKEFAKRRLFSIVDSNHPENLSEIASNLNDAYEVTDKDSMYKAIYGYDGSEYYGVLVNLLVKAYKDGELGEYAKFRRYMSDESLKEVLSVYNINFSNEDFEAYKNKFDHLARFFFGLDEDKINKADKFIKFYEQTKDILALCERTTISAFDYTRIMQIINDSYALGYIQKADYDELFGFYSNAAKSIFSGFDEYIASFLIGRAFMEFFEKESNFIDENLILRMDIFYIALNSPFDMFKESGIWSENLEEQKSRIKAVLEKFIDLSEHKKAQDEINLLTDELKNSCESRGFSLKRFEETLDLYLANFHNKLNEYGVEYLVDIPAANNLFTPLHEISDEYSFYGAVDEFCQKTKAKLENDELPLITTLYPRVGLITNKAVYSYSGLPFFKKLKRFTWAEVNFKIIVDSAGSIKCLLGKDKECFEIDLVGGEVEGYEKLSGKKVSLTDDEANQKMYKNEINALSLAFKQLKEKFN